MKQKDSFAGGFFLGAIVGGIVGGVVGSVLATKKDEQEAKEKNNSLLNASEAELLSDPENLASTRESLEAKIAQLNVAIDELRQNMGEVNHNS